MPEIIIVRSLTNSDLGIFAAHRVSATSKQRAININAPAAERLLTPRLYREGGTQLDCIVSFQNVQQRSTRDFSKVHKNWRLGGNKLEGGKYAQIDSADFLLLRSSEHNDGTLPVSIRFVSRATDKELHARIVGLVAYRLTGSVTVYTENDADFALFAAACSPPPQPSLPALVTTTATTPRVTVPAMPRRQNSIERRTRTIREKVRSATIIEQMIKVASDLSAPAQLEFLDTVEQLASQLRTVLLRTGRIVPIERDHAKLWSSVAGEKIGFVDGGMANLAMVGAAPVAVRVGGYIVTPGNRTPEREHFIVLKRLIAELYSSPDGGVYDGRFPDYGALRDAARISIEAAGAVRVPGGAPRYPLVVLAWRALEPRCRVTPTLCAMEAPPPFS